MKILDQNLNQSEIELVIDNLNDLWYLYNIILPNDIVYARTKRRIKQDDESARSKKGEKVTLYLGINVEKLGFHKFSNRLRISGKIIEGPSDLVSFHSYHTFNIEIHSQLKIIKNEWTNYLREKLNEAVENTKNPNYLILLIDKGECTIAEISDIGVKIVKSFTVSLPGKYYEVKYHKSALKDFFLEIYKIIKEHTNESIKNIIIGGPGFVKEHFFNFLREEKYSHLNNVVITSASSATVNSIYEVLKSDKIKSLIENLKINEEIELIDEIFNRIGKDLKTVALKMEDIQKAALFGAIDIFMILDKIFRESSVEKRKYYEEILKNVENKGGKIKIISSLHPAGEQLEKLGGTAALLRFPID